MRVRGYRFKPLAGIALLGALAAAVAAAGATQRIAVPLPANAQGACTPTYALLWEETHSVATSWATWEGNVALIGCLEHLALSPEERTRAQGAFEAALREEDLHLIRSSFDGPMRARITARINKEIGRVALTDWLLSMSRGEAT